MKTYRIRVSYDNVASRTRYVLVRAQSPAEAAKTALDRSKGRKPKICHMSEVFGPESYASVDPSEYAA